MRHGGIADAQPWGSAVTELSIEARNLSKKFGKTDALDNLSLAVHTGDIYGFIGPNGAGKSTTFKILSTILRPDSGSATIQGLDIRKGDAVRALIGYMPDVFGVYEDMSVWQYLDFFAAAYFIPAHSRRRLIGDILDLTDLEFKRDAMVQSLSRGMQQRLGVARVLVHDPKVLVLDEPASGLDPRARIELRELLKELARMGKTILISSHILSELSEMCSRFGIIEQGRLVFEGTQAELRSRLASGRAIAIEVGHGDLDRAFEILRAAPFAAEVSRADNRLALKLAPGFDAIHEVPAFLVERGIRLLRFSPGEVTLENAFMELTNGNLA